MADEWDVYAVSNTPNQTDEWDQYATSSPKRNIAREALGASALFGVGVPTAIGTGKVLGAMGNTLKSIPRVMSEDKSVNLAKEWRKAFVGAHTQKVNQFGQALEGLSVKYPDKTVSLTETVKDLINDWDEINPEVKTALKKTPLLGDFLGDAPKRQLTEAGSVSLKKTQDIINHINTKITPNIKANKLHLIDTVNNIKGEQLSAFPEMEGVRADYAAFKEPYKNVKQYFKFNRLLNSAVEGFGGAEGNAAVKQILPREVIKQIGGYRAASKLLNPLRAIAKSMLGRSGAFLGAAPQALDVMNKSKGVESILRGKPVQLDPFGGIRELTPDELKRMREA